MTAFFAELWVRLALDIILIVALVVNLVLTFRLRAANKQAKEYLESAEEWHKAALAERESWRRTHAVTRQLEDRLRMMVSAAATAQPSERQQ